MLPFREFDEYSATIRLARNESSPTAAAATQPLAVPPAATIPPRGAGSNSAAKVESASVGNHREKLIAIAVLIAALVAAGLILFV